VTASAVSPTRRPAEWADLIPQLEPGEVAVLLQWLPDEEIPEVFEELDPRRPRTLCGR
jgi:Mg/Co/Ni transporter MgtE